MSRNSNCLNVFLTLCFFFFLLLPLNLLFWDWWGLFFFFFFESILHFQFVVYFLSQFTVDVSAAANLFAGLS